VKRGKYSHDLVIRHEVWIANWPLYSGFRSRSQLLKFCVEISVTVITAVAVNTRCPAHFTLFTSFHVGVTCRVLLLSQSFCDERKGTFWSIEMHVLL
jgi:hypothetical protein